jgi:hypothetical protein
MSEIEFAANTETILYFHPILSIIISFSSSQCNYFMMASRCAPRTLARVKRGRQGAADDAGSARIQVNRPKMASTMRCCQLSRRCDDKLDFPSSPTTWRCQPRIIGAAHVARAKRSCERTGFLKIAAIKTSTRKDFRKRHETTSWQAV